MSEYEQIKALIDKQGESFDAFKKTLAEIEKKTDVISEEKMKRIESALDDAVEAKAQIEARLDAEAKEREALEAKFNRYQLSGSEESMKRQVEIKDFNVVLGANAAARKKPFEPLSEEGYDAYKTAQDHYLREGKDNLTPEELKTMSVGSDPDGGYFVTPDMGGRIVTKVYETSPMRQICAQQTISTDALEGIEDLNEAGAGYAGESSQGSDSTTPQVGAWRIPVYWIDTEPKATQQLLDDAAVNIEAWLAGKVSSKFARFENAEFVAGAVGKIRGLTSYETAADTGSGVAWGKFGHHATGANGGFASSHPINNLHDLVGLLKDAYLPNARWLTRRSVITLVRKWKDTTGRDLWMPSLAAGVPETLMGYPVTRAEDMPAVATGSLSMGFGDWRETYQIVDRQGIRVLRDPYTAKPFIKFYTTKRTGGGVLNFEAAKFLKFTS